MSDGPRVLRVGEEPPPLEPAPCAAPAGSPAGSSGRDRHRAAAPNAGRFAVLNAFVDCAMAGLNGAEVAVWLVLFRDCRDGTATTAQTSIAKRAGCNPRTVRRALARLEELGLIEVAHRGGLRSGLSRYRVRGEAG